STSVVMVSWPPGCAPSTTTGARLARAAYMAAVRPAGPEPRIITRWGLAPGAAVIVRALEGCARRTATLDGLSGGGGWDSRTPRGTRAPSLPSRPQRPGPHGRRLGEGRDGARGGRAGRGRDASGNTGGDRRRRGAQGRRAGRRAARGHHGSE